MKVAIKRFNKKKIINDPVHGFISLPYPILLDVIDHPWFQRLRRIHQLGTSSLVYPGATHTRFHHALGAMHLMEKALNRLENVGVEITVDERKACLLAILMHDIGHGPYSHTLEHGVVPGVHHEWLTLAYMNEFNRALDGELDLCISIFRKDYRKRFLSDLVSSQLDVDRLDYLQRDSVYTGVMEGRIGTDRLINMLNVHEGRLVVEEKGIYSVESFLVSRRIMYWQVYLHKTVVAAEIQLKKIIQRARELSLAGADMGMNGDLDYFLRMEKDPQHAGVELLERFSRIDDSDVMYHVKNWARHDDPLLGFLCRGMLERTLFKTEVSREPYSQGRVDLECELVMEHYGFGEDEARFLVYSGDLLNEAYLPGEDSIGILMKTGEVMDVAEASDNLNVQSLTTPVKKYVLSYPTQVLKT